MVNIQVARESPSVIVIAMTNEKDEKKEFVANGGKRLKLGDIDEETLNSGALGYDLVHFHYAE